VKFLIDNALSPLIAARLAEAEHDAIHVRDIDMAAATDERIFARAAAERRMPKKGSSLAFQHRPTTLSQWPDPFASSSPVVSTT